MLPSRSCSLRMEVWLYGLPVMVTVALALNSMTNRFGSRVGWTTRSDIRMSGTAAKNQSRKWTICARPGMAFQSGAGMNGISTTASRSEERRVGREWVSQCKYRVGEVSYKQKKY